MLSGAAFAEDFSWTVSEDVVSPEYWADRDADAEPGTYYDGEYFWMISSTGESQSVDKVNTWITYRGTSMDDLVEVSRFKADFEQPHGDDRYWLVGLWVDEETGRWYTTVHDEFNYFGSDTAEHERYILSATSDDHGKTWTLGDVIVSSYAPLGISGENPGRYYSFGVGDQKMYTDTKNGYFYMYYMEAWSDRENNYQYKTYNVARSPISAKMAAGSWKKFYNGKWEEPGIGGFNTPLFCIPGTGVYVAYNTYLERYMAIGMKKESNEAFICTCTDLEKQDWTTPERLTEKKILGWYNWGWDNDTLSRDTIGQTFRFYRSSHTSGPIEYRTITLNKDKPSDPTYFYSDYSRLKGKVHAHGEMFDMIPTYAHRENFSKGNKGWLVKSGSADMEVSQQQFSMKITNTGEEAAIVADDNAPDLSSGIIEATVTLDNCEEFGIILGYNENGKYSVLDYNKGKFTLIDENGAETKLCKKRLLYKTDTAYDISVTFRPRHLILRINENVVFDGDVDGLNEINGKYAFVVDKGLVIDNIAYYDGISVKIDDVPIGFDVKPMIINDRTLVPMRKIFELFGAEVTWDDATRSITAVKGNTEIHMSADSDIAYINDEKLALDTGAVVTDGRTLVPLRFISETLGADVSWDGDNSTVNISSNGNLAVALQTMNPYPVNYYDPAAAVGTVDYLLDYAQTQTNVGSFSTKKDTSEEYDMKMRIYRFNPSEPSARIYHIEDAPIQEVSIMVATQTTAISNYIKCYLSSDGENWTELKMKADSTKYDTTRSNMYYSQCSPQKKINGENHYFKIELQPVGQNWSSQICRVDINRTLYENMSDDVEPNQMYDRFNDYSNIRQMNGECYIEKDNRREYNCANRLYRKSSSKSAELIYEKESGIESLRIETYTEGINAEDYFEVYLSEDGYSWSKETMEKDIPMMDESRNNMYFSALKFSDKDLRNKYVKIVLKGGYETWTNQLVNVQINLGTERQSDDV